MFPALRPARLSALVLLLSFAGSATAEADWRRVDSPNLVVIGDIDEAELRDIAARLEGFRRTFGRMLDERSTATIVPTVVVALSSDRAFAPFAPKFDGQGVQSRGLFLGTPDVNYIVVNGRNGMRVVFHEYAHLMMSNVTRAAPLWLNEGLADYYSTFEAGNEGREVRLGRPIEAYVERLREATLLPLDQFLAVHSGSAVYNNGDQRTLFYAQAWALTHFLQLGEPDRTTQLASYLRRVASGAPRGSGLARGVRFHGHHPGAARVTFPGTVSRRQICVSGCGRRLRSAIHVPCLSGCRSVPGRPADS